MWGVTALPSMTIELTTLAAVRALGTWDAGDTDDDAALSLLITQYATTFEKDLCRHTQAQAYTEVYRVPQAEKIVTLRGAPVTAVTSVKYSGNKDWANETALTETDEWVQDADEATIQLLFQTRLNPGWAQIVYTGGMATNTAAFLTAFPDLSGACAAQVFYHWQRAREAPEGNVTVGGGSTSFTSALKLLTWVKEAVELHRRVYL